MALNDKIKSAVDQAFAKIDSLLVPVVFSNKAVSSFDFADGTIESTDTTFSTRGFREDKRFYVEGATSIKRTVLLKNEGIVISGYTTVNVDGIDHSFCMLSSNDFVMTIELLGVE
jgi:hypothetical protein